MDSLREYLLAYAVRESNYHRIVMSPAFEALDKALMIQLVRRHEMTQVAEQRTTNDVASRSGASAAHSPPGVEQLRLLPDTARRAAGEAAAARRTSSPTSTVGSPTPAPLSRRLSSAALLDIEMPLELMYLNQTLEVDLQRLHSAVAQSVSRAVQDPETVEQEERKGDVDQCGKELLDITLLLEGSKSFRAHAVILAARCHFFRGLLRSGRFLARKTRRTFFVPWVNAALS